jgi:short-subunit dehydrogenase
LQELAAQLSARGQGAVEVFVADLANPIEVEPLVERLATEPRLGLLVNNAGFGTLGRFWEASLHSQEQMHQLHVMATVRLTHAALGNMVPRDSGAIINVASVAGFARSQGSVSYCATKSWMNIFSEGLYLELRGMGSHVTVQTLCPGFTYSEFHDTMAIGREKLASKALWLTAEQVVDASLQGLKTGELYVIPGWRYRLLTAIISKLPSKMRLAVEQARGKQRVEASK